MQITYSLTEYIKYQYVPLNHLRTKVTSKIVSEYQQEIPQSQTADKPMVPRGRATQPSRYTRKTN